MPWQGFLKESKSYMNHPDHWKEWNAYPYKPDGWTAADRRRAKLRFWVHFPVAWVRFYFLGPWNALLRRIFGENEMT